MAEAQRGTRSALYLAAAILGASLLSGCKSGGGGGEPSASTSAPQSIGSGTPLISGSAPTAVAPNAVYRFKPKAQDPDGDTISFQIENKPKWATFNTVTGELYGKPSRSHIGEYRSILISASDGKASAQLSAFTITVSESAPRSGQLSVQLAWTAPTETLDGSPLAGLGGYVISYGKSASALTSSVLVDNPSIDRYIFDDLSPGTYYFAVRAISISGEPGELSKPVKQVVG